MHASKCMHFMDRMWKAYIIWYYACIQMSCICCSWCYLFCETVHMSSQQNSFSHPTAAVSTILEQLPGVKTAQEHATSYLEVFPQFAPSLFHTHHFNEQSNKASIDLHVLSNLPHPLWIKVVVFACMVCWYWCWRVVAVPLQSQFLVLSICRSTFKPNADLHHCMRMWAPWPGIYTCW